MGRESNKKRRQKQALTAREKAAAARGAQKQAEQRRRAIVIISSVVAVAVVAAVIAVVALNHKSSTTAIANNRAPAPASVVDPVNNVPASTLDTVNVGTVSSGPESVTGTPLTNAGKPEVLFIGAEFCPLCAAERWPMAVALSRFGTLDGVKLTQSASNDSYPDTATLDFIGTSYTSKYLTFTPVENEDRDHKQLEKVTPAQDALWTKYQPKGKGFPFLDFGNKYVISTPSYDPAVLKGLTQVQIASKLADPNDPVAKAIDGSANVLTATICGITNNQPAKICSSTVIKGISSKINPPATG